MFKRWRRECSGGGAAAGLCVSPAAPGPQGARSPRAQRVALSRCHSPARCHSTAAASPSPRQAELWLCSAVRALHSPGRPQPLRTCPSLALFGEGTSTRRESPAQEFHLHCGGRTLCTVEEA